MAWRAATVKVAGNNYVARRFIVTSDLDVVAARLVLPKFTGTPGGRDPALSVSALRVNCPRPQMVRTLHMNRRDFLAASTAAAMVAPSMMRPAGAADKPLRVGMIGCGWYGKSDLFRLIQVAPVEVVALCDVDSKMVAEAADLVSQRQASKKKPRTHGDYRELLKEKDCDVVIVDTPDHWHALPMIAAVEGGADVWVQKPISVDVLEGKAMLDAARKHNLRGGASWGCNGEARRTWWTRSKR